MDDVTVATWPTAPDPGVMVELRRIRKKLGSHQAIGGVSLRVLKGGVLTIIGPSGSGKTTVLRCVNQLERPDAGEVWVDGCLVGQRAQGGRLVPVSERHLREHRAEVGMVFQQFNLFPHMTVLDNLIEAPMSVRHLGKGAAIDIADELLRKVGLLRQRGQYRRDCQAVSSNASRSHAHWRCRPRSCSLTR